MMKGEKAPWDLLERTKEFALRIIRLYGALPRTVEAQVIGRQVLRSGTSVGAHLREGKRSRSDAELISKTEGALQETVYWLELLAGADIVKPAKLKPLMDEADALTGILVTSAKTIKKRKRRGNDE
jgi:four helix bundle protein